MTLREKLLKLDNFRWALMLGLPIALAILIPLLAAGAITGIYLIPDWLVNLFFVPSFIGGLTAAAGYIGRLIDGFTNWLSGKGRSTTLASELSGQKLNKTPTSPWEILFTLIGVAIGIAITLALILSGVGVPFAGILPFGLACIVFGLSNINTFAGLANRLGSSIGAIPVLFGKAKDEYDQKSRLIEERVAVFLAILIGLAIGLALVFTMGAGLVPVGGITAFFIGMHLPAAATGALFTLSFAGTLASATDYFARAGSYAKYLILKHGLHDKTQRMTDMESYISGRTHEYRGAFVGVSIGLIIGAIAIGVLLATQPYLFAGVLGAVALIMVAVAATSIIGGLAARIGRYLDGLKDEPGSSENAEEVSSEEDTLPFLPPPPSPTSSLTSVVAQLPCSQQPMPMSSLEARPIASSVPAPTTPTVTISAANTAFTKASSPNSASWPRFLAKADAEIQTHRILPLSIQIDALPMTPPAA